MLTGVQHLIHDIGLLFSFLFVSVQQIFNFILTPFTAVAELARGFFSSATAEPVAESLDFATGTFEVLEALPLYNTLAGVIGGAFILLMIFAIFKSFKFL